MCNLRTTLFGLIALFASVQVSADGMDGYPSLWESYDHGLQQQLEAVLKDMGLNKAARNKKLAVTLVDITDLEEPLVASVNGDTMIYAASLPKIAILMGAFVEIDHGNLTLDTDTRDSLTRMIRKSSNADATRMLNLVGKSRLLEILQDDEYDLYDERVNGGLWVGKEYGKAGAYQRDPVANLSHGATAMQAAKFYYLMETGRLANPELTREMKSMLGNPGIKHKFVKGLSSYPDAKIFRKSGSWSHWHADSALIEANGRKYIIVGLVDDKSGGLWLSRMIKPIHQFMVPDKLASNIQH